MVTRILDHVAQAASYADGEKIFALISEPIQRGDHVTLSFQGIDAVPSSFINAAIVRLVEIVTIDQIKARLHVVDSTRQINDLIRSRMTFLEQAAAEKSHSNLP